MLKVFISTPKLGIYNNLDVLCSSLPYYEKYILLISPRSEPIGVEGVAGTLDALCLKLPTRFIIGSSVRTGPESSRISFSVLPVYLNLVPQEKNPPPVTTGASVDFWRVKNSICSMAQRQTCRQAAPVGHLKPTVCFFCNKDSVLNAIDVM